MAAMVLSALGFCLLDGRPYRPGTYVFMRLGVTAYLASSIIGVVAETLELTSTAVYPMFVVYVTLAFVSQATIGCAALAMSELIPRWIGWATAIWNLAWLAILVLARPWDIYFPILHLIMPVFIGAALILRRRRESAPEADPLGVPNSSHQPGLPQLDWRLWARSPMIRVGRAAGGTGTT